MIRLQPLNDRVVIKRAEEAEEMSSERHIPDTAKKPQQGEVIAWATARYSKEVSVSL